MGRYRPATPPSSCYITPEGFESLQNEFSGLWHKRREVTQALAAAAAEGDRSENAEYIYRKKELRELDRRIRYLQKRLPQLKVVSTTPTDPVVVYFGAWVTVQTPTGKEVTYRIVGPDEFDPARGSISMDAPMARALLKKTLDDEITVDAGDNRTSYRILDVSYANPRER